jgi:capsular polysaccharide biosynthesis protein
MREFYIRKKLLIEAYTIQRRLPCNFAESEDKLFRPILTDPSREVNVYFAQNVFLVREVLIKGLRFIEEDAKIFTAPPFSMPLRSRIKRIAFFFASKTEVVEKGIWIINSWAGGYFHWFADALPKLLAAEKEVGGHKVLIPESYKKYPYIQYSLKKMGIDFFYFNDHISSVRHFKKYKIKDLLIVDELSYFNPAVMGTLRKKFSERYSSTADPYRKIYISREKALRRKILNEAEVRKTIKEFGFEIHYFEDYYFEKQVELISQCKFLISLHGAGLTNMLFMKDGTNVLEFKQEGDFINGGYYSLANSLKINYYYLLCRGNSEVTQDSDFVVDTEKLIVVIQQMLNDNQKN